MRDVKREEILGSARFIDGFLSRPETTTPAGWAGKPASSGSSSSLTLHAFAKRDNPGVGSVLLDPLQGTKRQSQRASPLRSGNRRRRIRNSRLHEGFDLRPQRLNVNYIQV